MATVYAGCLQILRPGGLLVTVTRNLRRQGRVFDLAGATVTLAEQAGYQYLQHVVALLAAVRDSGLHARPSFWQLTNRVPVAYCQDDPCGLCQQAGGFQQHDPADSLTEITAEQAALPAADKIRLFLGEDALARYRHSLGPWPPDTHGRLR
jgi:hypothetical protein